MAFLFMREASCGLTLSIPFRMGEEAMPALRHLIWRRRQFQGRLKHGLWLVKPMIREVTSKLLSLTFH